MPRTYRVRPSAEQGPNHVGDQRVRGEHSDLGPPDLAEEHPAYRAAAGSARRNLQGLVLDLTLDDFGGRQDRPTTRVTGIMQQSSRALEVRCGELGLAQAGVSAEKECLIMNDRAAECPAELIAMQGRFSEGVPGVRVQAFVSEKVEEATAEVVRAGARSEVDATAGGATVFG